LRKIDTKKSLAVRIIATPAIEAFLKCLIELETASEEAHGRCYDMIVSYNEFSEEEFERGKKAGREEAEEDFKDRLEQAEKVAEDIGRDNAYEDPDFIPDPLKDELEELYTEVQDNCNPCPRTGIGGTYGEEGTSVCVVPEPCSFYVIRKRVDKTLSKRGY
jgi:flagellar biosynthesis/type III secretory pathway protein FliH